MKKQTKCPKCHGYRILERKKVFIGLIATGVIFSFWFFPLVFVPIGAFGLLFPNKKSCMTCGYQLPDKK